MTPARLDELQGPDAAGIDLKGLREAMPAVREEAASKAGDKVDRVIETSLTFAEEIDAHLRAVIAALDESAALDGSLRDAFRATPASEAPAETPPVVPGVVDRRTFFALGAGVVVGVTAREFRGAGAPVGLVEKILEKCATTWEHTDGGRGRCHVETDPRAEENER